MDSSKRNAFKTFGALGLTAAASPIIKSHTTGEAPYNTEPREPTVSTDGVKGAYCLPLVPIREEGIVEKDGVG